MNDVLHAADLARQYLQALVADARSVRVEEVEPSDDEAGWLITLSFVSTADAPLEQFTPRRLYKRFHVTEDGVRSMTIRELTSV